MDNNTKKYHRVKAKRKIQAPLTKHSTTSRIKGGAENPKKNE
jgi:hypothetical protein